MALKTPCDVQVRVTGVNWLAYVPSFAMTCGELLSVCLRGRKKVHNLTNQFWNWMMWPDYYHNILEKEEIKLLEEALKY